MKHVLVLSLAWLGTMGAPATALSQGHGGHGAQTNHHASQGHHGTPGLTQEEIANMPLSKTVQITDCWIRHLPLPAPSAGYFVANNSGAEPAVLTAATSPRYGDVMLHQTTHTDGMSRMSSVDGAEIAPDGRLDFKPGGYHIMLERPQGEIKVGDSIPMQFVFASQEKAQAQCEVKPPNTLAK